MNNSLQNILQYKFLSKFQTKNPIVNAFLDAVIYASITGLLSTTPTLLAFIIYYLKIYYWIIHFKLKTKEKSIQIDYITDNKQINELYKAVFWYLSNNNLIDYDKEASLKFTYEKTIAKDFGAINKIIVNHEWKTLKYKNEIISYYLTNNLITIYSDKEKKRENFTVYLKASNNKIIEDFSKHCMQEFATSIHGTVWTQKIFINCENSKNPWDSSASNNKRRLETISLKEGQLENLLEDLNSFLKSEDWYNEHDIPYSRGYLLYGKPGTGKTSIIKGISNYCKRHIHYLNLSQVATDNELIGLLKKINYKETILVIEDIDCMLDSIKERKNDDSNIEIKKQLEELKDSMDKLKDTNSHGNSYGKEQRKSYITLSGLLNAIDGVFNNDGRILIMTTNRPEELDSALLRAGRIDRKYHLSYCDQHQVNKIYHSFFGEDCDEKQLENIKNGVYSPAHMSGLFLKYKNNPKEALLHIDEDVQILQSSVCDTSVNTTVKTRSNDGMFQMMA